VGGGGEIVRKIVVQNCTYNFGLEDQDFVPGQGFKRLALHRSKRVHL